jgi:hypothetical protein
MRGAAFSVKESLPGQHMSAFADMTEKSTPFICTIRHVFAAGEKQMIDEQPGPLSKPATIRDVASRAEVSYMTVSRVLNESPNVLPTTRSRVLAAMDELQYQPSEAGRALAAFKRRR